MKKASLVVAGVVAVFFLTGCRVFSKRLHVVGSVWQSPHVDESVVKGESTFGSAGSRVDMRVVAGATIELVDEHGKRIDDTTTGTDGRFWLGYFEQPVNLVVTAGDLLQVNWKVPRYRKGQTSMNLAIILKSNDAED